MGIIIDDIQEQNEDFRVADKRRLLHFVPSLTFTISSRTLVIDENNFVLVNILLMYASHCIWWVFVR